MVAIGTPRRNGIRDVAERAGVSVGTVSNVLNNPVLVAGATRQRVQDAIIELGFVRNASARQLRAGTNRAVGALVLDIANPFFTEVARGVEDRLAANDFMLILCSSDEQIDKEQRYLRLLEEQGVQGVLITPTERDPAELEGLRRRGTSVVLLDRVSTRPDVCSVAVDDVRGGELAAGHLISLGHRRIGFVNGSTKIRQCSDRRRGVRRALRTAGLPFAESLIEITASALNAHGGEAAMEELLGLPDPPSAIVCVNDLTALGVLRSLRNNSIAVPSEIAVVGYDDVEFAAMLARPLTSVRQPKYQLGWAAADLLLRESSEGADHRHQQILFQPDLIVRASTDGQTAPGSDPPLSSIGRLSGSRPGIRESFHDSVLSGDSVVGVAQRPAGMAAKGDS